MRGLRVHLFHRHIALFEKKTTTKSDPKFICLTDIELKTGRVLKKGRVVDRDLCLDLCVRRVVSLEDVQEAVMAVAFQQTDNLAGLKRVGSPGLTPESKYIPPSKIPKMAGLLIVLHPQRGLCEFKCVVCGVNTHRGTKKPIKGVAGMLTHIQGRHQDVPTFQGHVSRKLILSTCLKPLTASQQEYVKNHFRVALRGGQGGEVRDTGTTFHDGIDQGSQIIGKKSNHSSIEDGDDFSEVSDSDYVPRTGALRRVTQTRPTATYLGHSSRNSLDSETPVRPSSTQPAVSSIREFSFDNPHLSAKNSVGRTPFRTSPTELDDFLIIRPYTPCLDLS
ncbi:hypothetical protein EJ08DRAFT_356965 [Tothia fuscella]|uniref:Uncharacterized protein n=1 Tax=Tothia fuscella TaxID=1048955 RepID=A0A9P4NMS1_9PEZI|nr:hypothetical protein EJ08DRAFT_356965 [Tothia fuscella]